MSWSKLAVLIMLLTVMIVTSIFGSHFGFTVRGVEFGGTPVQKYEVTEHQGLIGKYYTYINEDGNLVYSSRNPNESDLPGDMMAFVFGVLGYQIDGMPAIFTFLFWIMTFIILYIVVTAFLPGGGD